MVLALGAFAAAGWALCVSAAFAAEEGAVEAPRVVSQTEDPKLAHPDNSGAAASLEVSPDGAVESEGVAEGEAIAPEDAAPAVEKPAPPVQAIPIPGARPDRVAPAAPARPSRAAVQPPPEGGETPPAEKNAAAPKQARENGKARAEFGPDLDVDPKEPLYLDYDDVDLEQVVRSIGARTGKNFDVDPTLGANKVTIISHSPVPPALAYDILGAIVSSKGGKMIEAVDGGLVHVIPEGKGAEKSPVHKGLAEQPEGYDSLSTHIITLQYADVTELSAVLQSLGSETARVVVYGVTNTLVLTDSAYGIRRMLAFIQEVDIAGFEQEIDLFTLRYARADVLAQQIQDVLISPESGMPQAPIAAAAQAAQAARAIGRPVRAPVPGQPEQVVVGARAQSLRIVADERLNALIVVATTGIMEQVRDLLDKLDTPTPIEYNNMHVYHLLNAKAEDVETALSSFFGNVVPRQEGGGGAGGGATAGPTAEVQAFEKKVSVTRYDKSNALLIMASPIDYKLVESVIKQIDLPRRQVHVEAVIVKVTISDNYRLDVELTDLDANDAFTLSNIARIANVMSGDLLSAGGNGLSFGIIDGVTKIPVVDDAGTLGVQYVPNVPLLLSALETLTSLDVLSQPSLTGADNEDAEIVIGQQVPVVTGSSRSLNQTADARSSVYNSVNREDIGTKVKVKPQISEGDYVCLEIAVEVSSLASASDSVGDANILGPTFDKTEIKDIIVVKDGSTGVMGGLISESSTSTRYQTPWLGDLPGLGWLFRRNTNIRAKQNLVVLLTPHIIKDSNDSERLAAYRTNEAAAANADVIFQRGYLKKVRQKHYNHTRLRPGQERIELLQRGEQGFQRGDIQ